MSPQVRIFDRDNLVPGLHVGRRASAPISKGILMATGVRTEPIWKLPIMGYDAYFEEDQDYLKSSLSKDAPAAGQQYAAESAQIRAQAATVKQAKVRGIRRPSPSSSLTYSRWA